MDDNVHKQANSNSSTSNDGVRVPVNRASAGMIIGGTGEGSREWKQGDKKPCGCGYKGIPAVGLQLPRRRSRESWQRSTGAGRVHKPNMNLPPRYCDDPMGIKGWWGRIMGRKRKGRKGMRHNPPYIDSYLHTKLKHMLQGPP